MQNINEDQEITQFFETLKDFPKTIIQDSEKLSEEEVQKMLEEEERARIEEYEQNKRDRIEAQKNEYLDSVMDKKYRDWEFSDLIINEKNSAQIEKLIYWIEDFKLPNWLVISGGQGTGKTLIKNILIKELYKKGFKCDSYDYQKLSIAYQDRISGGKLMELFNSLTHDKIMIIDELGRKKATEGFFDFMFSVINQMYLDDKTVILVTNLPVSNEGVGGFVDMDRLKENAKSIIFQQESFRGKK